MPELRCADYGFDCSFEVRGDLQGVVDGFAAHTRDEHGIEYSVETIMQFVSRKK